jgi:hypothetical protein
MGRRKETREIDGAKYTIRQMGSLTSLRVKAQLLKVLGKPIATLVAAEGVTALFDLDMDGDGAGLIAKGFEKLAETADPDVIVEIALAMVVGNVQAEFHGSDIDIDDRATYEEVLDQHSPWHQLKLLRACVAVNFLPTGAGGRTGPSTAGSSAPTPEATK